VDERVAAVPGVPGLRPRRTRSRVRFRTRHRWPRSRRRHIPPDVGGRFPVRDLPSLTGQDNDVPHATPTARQPHAGLASYAATARLLVGTRVR
jgi:hypothetical protein